MDYKPLIQQAITRQKWTRYRLAKELGFKAVSAIYRVENGENGLSAPKLMRLLELAGKTLAGAALTIAALLSASGVNEAHAAQHDAGIVRAALNTSIHYAKCVTRKIQQLAARCKLAVRFRCANNPA